MLLLKLETDSKQMKQFDFFTSTFYCNMTKYLDSTGRCHQAINMEHL